MELGALESLAAIFGLPAPNGNLALSCGKCLSQITATEQNGRVVFICSGGCTEDELMGGLCEIEPKFADWWLSGGLGPFSPGHENGVDDVGKDGTGGLTDDGRGIEERIQEARIPDRNEHANSLADNRDILRSAGLGHQALETQMPRQRGNSDEAFAEGDDADCAQDKDNEPHLNGQPHPYQPESLEEQKRLWKGRVGRLCYEILKADPEYHKAHLTIDMIQAPLRDEVFERVRNGPYAQAYPAYAAPDWLDEGEVWAIIGNAVEVAWEQFREKERNDLIVAHGPIVTNVNVVSVYDLANQPALSALRVYEADEFFDETAGLENIEWLWDRVAPSTGLIGVFGDPEAGKSTFSRSWALSSSMGVSFLDRTCVESKVLYLDLANERLSHRRAFQKLGWNRGNLKLISQESLIGLPNGLELVENAVKEIGARTVFVDMMADLLRFKDLNDYADAKAALRGLRLLSERTKALFVALHHTPKAMGPDADVLKAALGSQAIVGAFDLRMAVRRRAKDLSTLVMSNGKLGGEPLTEEVVLVRNADTEWLSLGQPWGRARADYYLEKVIAFLQENRGERMAATRIAEEMGLNPGWIRGSLAKAAKDGRLAREKSGRAFVYWVAEGAAVISQPNTAPTFDFGGN